MDYENQDQDIYGLICKLCENLIRQEADPEDHPYLPKVDNRVHLRKLKSKAYEILLKKSSRDFGNYEKSVDPIVELLKYAFDLKVSHGCISQADELQQYLDEFIDEKLDPNSVTYSVLQFLNCLKSLDPPDIKEDSLDIFHFGKPHPQLPEMFYRNEEIQPFQIYPIQSFYLPQKFEKKFKEKSNSILKFNIDYPEINSSRLNHFSSCLNFEKQIARYEDNMSLSLSSIPSHTSNLLKGVDSAISSYFIPQIKDIDGSDDQYQICQEGIVTEPETPWQCKDPLQLFAENIENMHENYTEISEIKESNSEEDKKRNLDIIWETMDKISPVSSHKTWESLGNFEPPKEPPFASESIDATLHIVNVVQNSIFNDECASDFPIEKISTQEFIKCIKLLLLGVESDTFIYDSYTGFEIKKNIMIHGISPGTLENVCEEVTQYGSYYRKLSELIVPDSTTEKLKIDGLIFKALCSSLKEFLLFYHAATLKVTMGNNNDSLLKFLQKIRPLGNLIFKVAELCRCDSHRETSLGEGIGILTHIYKEVTKVTEQNVALVFYSILKECCEIYFRFLQQWIFEGLCVDYYEEFMIKVRPQYTRTRGHRFWTRAFSINKESVPGFLSELTDAILQCGKTVALLRICDPKNPLCQMSASNQPSVRVCLSVGMLREQAKFYEDYFIKGVAEQGEEVSLSTAIKEQKETEKRRAELVIAAQKDTLERLQKERKEARLRISKEKIELLEQLKIQAEEAAQRKKKDKDAEFFETKAIQFSYSDKLPLTDAEINRNKILYSTDFNLNQPVTTSDTGKLPLTDIEKNRNKVLSVTDLNSNESDISKAEKLPPTDVEINRNKVLSATDLNLNLNQLEINSESEKLLLTDAEINRNKVLSITRQKLNQAENIPDSNNLPLTDAQMNRNKVLFDTDFNLNRPENIPESNDLPLTDAQINRNKILSVTDLNLNLNEPENVLQSKNLPLTDAQMNRNKVLFVTDFNLNQPENIPESNDLPLTDAQINRKKVLSATDLNLNLNEPENVLQSKNLPLTDAQMNRNKVLFDTDFNLNRPENIPESNDLPLTDAQINRNKVMTHFYMDQPNTVSSQKSGKLTEWQINRNRNMAHSTQQFDYDGFKNIDHEQLKDTPMSTNTDYFTGSTNSASLAMLSCEDSPLTENNNSHSEILSGRSSDGMSVDDISPFFNHKHFRDTPSFPNFIGFGSTLTTPSLEKQQLTAADVKMIDSTSLKVYLEKSVVIPLIVQSRLVNSAIIKYLLREHKMLSHLHSLRSFFFLLNGEFARSLTQSLFTKLYNVSTPAELFNSSTLSNFLDNALVSSLSSTYANSELLSLSATNAPAYLQTSNPEILSCLSLNYKISWPLNIIFNDIVMQQYSKVFKFLLMVGHVLWVLKEDFHILKTARKHVFVQNHHKLQLYRHAMMQFMNALHTYLSCSVLHASWSEFEKELENATTLDEVNSTHVSYIKKILSRCMLNSNGETMRTCLCNIFKVVLKFHNRIRAQNWNGDARKNGPNYDTLEKMYIAFCEQRTYLARVANKLASSGYQPHLMQFLHALNINHRYDLASKK